jgi:hypothetical protein
VKKEMSEEMIYPFTAAYEIGHQKLGIGQMNTRKASIQLKYKD